MSTGTTIGSIFGMVIGGVLGFWLGAAIVPMLGGAMLGLSIGGGIGGLIDPLTPDVSSVGSTKQDPSDLSKPTATEGAIVPELIGMGKFTGNYLWYGGNRSEEIIDDVEEGGTTTYEGGKGGGSTSVSTDGTTTSHYEYYLTWIQGLCLGPINGVYALYRDQECIWSGEVTNDQIDPLTGRATITIEDFGTVYFYFGTSEQMPPAELNEYFDDPMYNQTYRGFAYALFYDCWLGDYNRVPAFYWILYNRPSFTLNNDQVVLTDYDVNPAHILWHILTEAHLCAVPYSLLDESSFIRAAQTLYAEDMGIGLLLNSQSSALTYLESILSHIDGYLRYTSLGKIELELVRGFSSVDDMCTIELADLIDAPNINRRAWLDTINELKVQYNKRSNTIDWEDCIEHQPTVPCWKFSADGYGDTSVGCILINKEGEAYGCGTNAGGMFGDVVRDDDDCSEYPNGVSVLRRIGESISEQIVHAFVGDRYSGLVTYDGKFFLAGDGERELGIGDDYVGSGRSWLADYTKVMSGVVYASVGTFVVKDDGTLWGTNVPDADGNLLSEFTKLSPLNNWRKTVTTRYSVFCLNSRGEVWVYRRSGTFGEFTMITGSSVFCDISLGGSFSYLDNWLSDWKDCIKIVIDSSVIDDDLEDFPLRVYLSSSSGLNGDDVTQVFSSLGSYDNRKKIAVTTSNGIRQCFVEIERWDQVNNIAVLHVSVPHISSTSDTVLCLYYDSSKSDNSVFVGDPCSPVSAHVWGEGYKAVYHFNNDPSVGASSVKDSSGFALHMTAYNMEAGDLVDSFAGGKALDFDGVNEYLTGFDLATNGVAGQFTVEGLFNADVTAVMSIMSDNTSGSDQPGIDCFNNNGEFLGRSQIAGVKRVVSGGTWTPSTWYHYSLTYNGSELFLCVNGELIDIITGLSGSIFNSYALFSISKRGVYATPYYFNGKISSVRVSSIGRTIAWLKATYNSLFDTLVSFPESNAYETADAVLPYSCFMIKEDCSIWYVLDSSNSIPSNVTQIGNEKVWNRIGGDGLTFFATKMDGSLWTFGADYGGSALLGSPSDVPDLLEQLEDEGLYESEAESEYPMDIWILPAGSSNSYRLAHWLTTKFTYMPGFEQIRIYNTTLYVQLSCSDLCWASSSFFIEIIQEDKIPFIDSLRIDKTYLQSLGVNNTVQWFSIPLSDFTQRGSGMDDPTKLHRLYWYNANYEYRYIGEAHFIINFAPWD